MKVLRGSMFLRILRCIPLLLVCLFFTGCRLKLPVFVADDSSVMNRFQSGLADMDQLSGNVDYCLKRTSGEQAIDVSGTGSFYGSVKNAVDLSYELTDSLTESVSDNQANDVASHRMILDISDGLLYSQVNKDWVVYSDAMSMVDVKWWKSFFEDDGFGYDGKGTLSGNSNSGYLLSGVFHGDMIDDIVNHLHIDMGGSFDATDSEIVVRICADTRTGMPYQMSFEVSDNGASIQVLDDEGLVWTVDELKLSIMFNPIDEDFDLSINIPDEAKNAVVIFPSSDMVVENNMTINGNTIVSPDKKWAVSFADHKVFDTVDIKKKKSMVVTSSAHVAGDPQVTLSFVENEDAYNSVITDQQVALEYYNQEPALSEVYVSEKVTASTINSHSAYSYIQQYSDMAYGIANTDYCTYVDLGDKLYLNIKISSMVDLGVSNVLTEDYAQSILKNIEISAVE